MAPTVRFIVNMKRSAEKDKFSLTLAQEDAATSIETAVAMLAGAGSGKTRTLIARCLNIIGNRWDMLDQMLIITFTEKAAAELKRRLKIHIPDEELFRITSSWIGTFHSFAARILRQHAPILGFNPDFKIIDENASITRNRDIISSTLLELLNAEDEGAIEIVNDLQFKNTLSLMEKMLESGSFTSELLDDDKKYHKKLKFLYERCLNEIESYSTLTQTLDFSQLEIKLLELLKKEKSVLKDVQRRFKHILVDEFQDTSTIQTELISLLTKDNSSKLCIVGDPRQSIYRFRGANSRSFLKGISIVDENKGAVKILKENFRSNPVIVNYINELFTKIEDDPENAYGLDMDAKNDSKSLMPPLAAIRIDLPEKTLTSERRSAEAESIAKYVSQIIKDGRKPSEIVCLFKAMTNTSIYEAAFKIHKIPYRIHGGYAFLERQEISDLMLILKFAANPHDYISMMGILRSPIIGMSDEEIYALAGLNGKDLRENLRKTNAQSILKFLEEDAKLMQPSEILTEIIERTDYTHILHAIDFSGSMEANLERFIDLTRNEEDEISTTLPNFVGFLNELKSKGARIGDPPATALTDEVMRCMTVHASKGLEFPIVILPDLFHQRRSMSEPWCLSQGEGFEIKATDLNSPFGKRLETEEFKALKSIEEKEIIAEEKRLLYVAMTRAMEQLVLLLHPNIKTRAKETWHDLLLPNTSDFYFIGNNVFHPLVDIGAGPRAFPPNEQIVAELKNTNFNLTLHPQSFTVSHLECYNQCPMQYYYKYILGFPPSRHISKNEPINAITRGTILHGVIARVKDLKSIPDLIKTESLKQGIIPDEATLTSFQSLLMGWLDTPLGKRIAEGEHELNFEWKVDERSINGTVDWFLSNDDGIEIIDFKTDKVESEEAEKRASIYDLQLSIYALAIEAAKKQLVKKTSIVFLNTATTIEEDFDDKRRSATLKKLKEIFDGIENSKFDASPDQKLCYHCTYFKRGCRGI
ncbi:MAG: ATP-dependent DNA helicase [Pseudomonadota bacterium]